MTPEISVLISGVIFMTKYTKEIKLAIYHEWVNDYRRGTYLSRKYGMGRGGIQYLVAWFKNMVKIFWIALNRNILLISSLLPLIEFC